MKLVTLILVLSLAVAASAEDLKTYYEKTLKAIDQLDPTCPDRAAYLASVACCTSRLNVLMKVTFEHPSWPQRYGESARWLLAELHEAAPLPRLSHEMDAIQRKLEVAGTGPETQRAQERVIAELDALIKKMREREGRGDEDSNANRDGDTRLREKQDLAYQREWAKDALRHPDALQALDRLKFPGYYRDLVQQYWKSLAETKPCDPWRRR